MVEDGTRKLGERFLEEGIIEEDELRVGLERQKADDHRRTNPYQGVTGLDQVLPITNQIRRCLLDGKGHAAFEKATESIPPETLRQKGTRKVREGKTSIQEVLRVTFREDLTEDFPYPADT